MILCNDDCIPCCDYCLYSMHERIPINGKMIDAGPVGCFKHDDAEHHNIARGCGYCEDFHCKNAKLEEAAINA